MLEDIRLAHLITGKFALVKTPLKKKRKRKTSFNENDFGGRIYWEGSLAIRLSVTPLNTSFDERTQVNVDFQMVQPKTAGIEGLYFNG